MEFVIYTGCLMPSRLPYLESSTRKVLDALGVDYVDSTKFSCCFDPILLKSLSLDLWLMTAARNITVAEELGRNILTLCNGCFSSLNEANHYLKTDKELLEKVNAALSDVGREFKGSIEVVSLTKALLDIGEEKIGELTVKRLEDHN
ncbi:MAG: CoB--CoM heterodisulfide reductase subunit B, partial [Thermoplasmata archaeon]|nr:CoB--CoM heterodisulfide reductase subunit B [Thermoplasmata archaeon]